MKRLALIGGGAAVVLTATYFGLSAYSSKQAEKRLEDWVYDMELDDKLSWSSVSASPFGGSVSIARAEPRARSAPAPPASRAALPTAPRPEASPRLRRPTPVPRTPAPAPA